MKILKRLIKIVSILVVILFVTLVLIIRVRHGGGEYFPDRSGTPTMAGTALEVVADLEKPPGNIAVSDSGRIFFTFHPEGGHAIKLAELVNGKPVAYPDESFQQKRDGAPFFETVLSVRIDRQHRLWALDYATHGTGQPRLLGFDLNNNGLVHHYDFPADIAGLGSMLNDFQIDPKGEKIYIAEASIFAMTPAIVVYDIAGKKARRVLENHASVVAQKYIPRVRGRDMQVFGLFAIRPGVDSIALDRRGEWLYYAPVTNDNLYRIKTADLNDESLTGESLATKVETFALKTMSDGLTSDLDDNIYITDMEHSALHTIGPDRKLQTLIKDERLRWPDGLSFGPDNWLYVTCSSLQDVIMKSPENVKAHAPYQIFRFKPGPASLPGQ